MEEKPISDQEFVELHRMLQEDALVAYPNPGRVNCPGPTVLREIAYTPWLLDHPGYKHVVECSPCLRELLTFRDAYERERRRRKIWLWIGMAAALLITTVSVVPLMHHSAPSARKIAVQNVRPNIILAFDLASARDSDIAGDKVERELPHDVVLVKLLLPRRSPSGDYTIAINRQADRSSVITEASAKSYTDGEREVVSVVLDLRAVAPGPYFLATLLGDEVKYYSVEVS